MLLHHQGIPSRVRGAALVVVSTELHGRWVGVQVTIPAWSPEIQGDPGTLMTKGISGLLVQGFFPPVDRRPHYG